MMTHFTPADCSRDQEKYILIKMSTFGCGAILLNGARALPGLGDFILRLGLEVAGLMALVQLA
jgi:hypothetical protein